MAATIDLAEYLFTRIRQVGVKAVHGVPGDYNLTALDYIEPAGLDWVGNANELNAGYAADGYARIRGVSALVTAFGVGELSAINAVAGAYAELAPVIHIVGTVPTHVQDAGLCMHHSLGDGDFKFVAEMYEKITVAQADLRNSDTAPSQIDRCIRECILQSRPVYIQLPTNMVKVSVPANALNTPIDLSMPLNDEGFEDTEVELILNKMYCSKQPFIVVDGCSSRYGVSEEADELVRVTGFPTSTTPFGKGIVNEEYPNFYGIYAGVAGQDKYMPWAKGCDLVIKLGPLESDVNTFGFSTVPDPRSAIVFHRNHVEIGGTRYNNLHIKSLLRKILNKMDRSKLPHYKPSIDLGSPREQLAAVASRKPDDAIDQETFWLRLSNFIRSGDIVMVESGTPGIGCREMVLPAHTSMVVSSIWLSIGYMLPASQGAALAQREMIAEGKRREGRTILIEGDGSLQMTAQSISDMIRNRVDITILIINNDGYVIERWIHGMTASYNDIQPWRYLEAPNYFGAPKDDPEYPVCVRRALTWGQLEAVLADPAIQKGKGMKLIEVMMDRYDAPDVLKKLVQTTKRRNSGEAAPDQKREHASHEEKIVKAIG
jgi:pyruvate decarboxylase